jgi:predicted metal-dependent HD superfamily phosphohydrolase
MATRHRVTPESPIDKLVVDIDISILSAPEKDFDAYEKAVRKEYAFVEDAAWRAGRTQILQSFLDREWIYSTQSFRKREADARTNLKRSIAKLAT